MTIELVCECGAVLQAPDSAAGKQGRCKACGRMIAVPRPKRRAEDEARELDPLYHRPPGLQDREAGQRPPRGFWADAAWGFILCGQATNLIPLACVWVLYGLFWLLGFARFFGMIGLFLMLLGRFFVAGWLSALWMNVIRETAGGEDEIPALKWESGVCDDIAVPFFAFLGSLIAVMAPAIIAGILAYVADSAPLAIVGVGLAALGLFAWPAALLVVSIGGASAALQLDAIALTITRSFLPYLAVVGLIAAAVGVYIWFGAQSLDKSAEISVAPGSNLVLGLVHAWAMIVSMRCIGLYYRHFKHRFPWAAE